MHLLKFLVTNFLPPALLFWVKKHYYSYTIRTFWEPDVEPMKSIVKSGDCSIDIGANIGWYSNVLATLVGPSGKVYSVEPIADTFRLLSAVMAKQGVKNVELLNYAISERDGTAVMEIPLYEYGGKNFYMARIMVSEARGDSVRQRTVSVRSVDSLFLNSPERITFVKCDVEGHELAVIKGASHFLRNFKPAWLIEVSGSPEKEGSSANQLFEIMKGYGYAVLYFDGRQLREALPGCSSVNYFFLQPAHMLQLRHIIAPSSTLS